MKIDEGTMFDRLYNKLREANQLRRNNQFQEAVTIYREYIQQEDQPVEFLTIISHLTFRMAFQNPDQAEELLVQATEAINEALAIEPNNPLLRLHLAEIYNLGTLEYELAAQEYRAIIELNPQNVSALIGAASLYGLPEKVVSLEEATSWMRKATELESTNPQHYIRLGSLYKEGNQLREAQWAWLKALLCPEPLESDDVKSITAQIV